MPEKLKAFYSILFYQLAKPAYEGTLTQDEKDSFLTEELPYYIWLYLNMLEHKGIITNYSAYFPYYCEKKTNGKYYLLSDEIKSFCKFLDIEAEEAIAKYNVKDIKDEFLYWDTHEFSTRCSKDVLRNACILLYKMRQYGFRTKYILSGTKQILDSNPPEMVKDILVIVDNTLQEENGIPAFFDLRDNFQFLLQEMEKDTFRKIQDITTLHNTIKVLLNSKEAIK